MSVYSHPLAELCAGTL